MSSEVTPDYTKRFVDHEITTENCLQLLENVANANSDSDGINHISDIEKGIEAGVLFIICIVSLVGNISLWFIVLGNRALRTNSNKLVLCLSAADILVSMINMPVTIYSIIQVS